MSKHLLQHIAQDIVIWVGIVWGLYMGQPQVANATVFALWALAVIGLLSGFNMISGENEAALYKAGKKRAERTPLHRWYAGASVLAEALALAALGHFWLAGVWLFASLVVLAGFDEAEKHYKKTENPETQTTGEKTA